MQPITDYTLGKLLTYKDSIIKRNSISILKRLMELEESKVCEVEGCNIPVEQYPRCADHY